MTIEQVLRLYKLVEKMGFIIESEVVNGKVVENLVKRTYDENKPEEVLMCTSFQAIAEFFNVSINN